MKYYPSRPNTQQVHFPGKMEAQADLENRRLGLLLPEDTLQSLKQVAIESGQERFLPKQII